MHRTGIAVNDGQHRHVAVKCFFDTKSFAMNRHEVIPGFHSSSIRRSRFNVRFTPEILRCLRTNRRTPTINHACAAFTENKRYRIKRAKLSTW
jgi:hypothetical protein